MRRDIKTVYVFPISPHGRNDNIYIHRIIRIRIIIIIIITLYIVRTICERQYNIVFRVFFPTHHNGFLGNYFNRIIRLGYILSRANTVIVSRFTNLFVCMITKFEKIRMH